MLGGLKEVRGLYYPVPAESIWHFATILTSFSDSSRLCALYDT